MRAKGRPREIEAGHVMRAQVSEHHWAVLTMLAERQGVTRAHVVRQLIELAGLEIADVDG